jgi:hypothetical protein
MPDNLLYNAGPAQEVYPACEEVVWSRVCSAVQGAGSYQILSANANKYEPMSVSLVAGALWHLFSNAREYLSHTRPGFPDSQLFALRDCLQSCSLKVTINCPVDLLLERSAGSAAIVARTSSVGGSRGSRTLRGINMDSVDADRVDSSTVSGAGDGRRKVDEPNSDPGHRVHYV